MAAERDYIGPDPVAWVLRLRDVNDGSSFTCEQKLLIEMRLLSLQQELEDAGGKRERSGPRRDEDASER